MNIVISRLWWAYRRVRQWLRSEETSGKLRDFATTQRVLPLSVMAVAIGVLNTFVVLALFTLIGFFTNLYFFRR